MSRSNRLSPIEATYYEYAKPCIPDLEAQVQIGKYRVDFLVPQARLIIELDGHAWHSNRWQRTHDAQRDRTLQLAGYRTIHFTGSEVYHNPIQCVRETLLQLGRNGTMANPPIPRTPRRTRRQTVAILLALNCLALTVFLRIMIDPNISKTHIPVMDWLTWSTPAPTPRQAPTIAGVPTRPIPTLYSGPARTQPTQTPPPTWTTTPTRTTPAQTTQTGSAPLE